ncbi:sialidase family protein [Mucilaginibacter terrae]|uniref:Sialidase domain-containing protein n=1 Tax=Mucilaginibacter terrae TaxID=1955052 RepID=A0ABU3GV31_9SPHI|nr:sialidase family protein [Mucilaginibacter terrae]MDT3403629.1 hypothetical protein [Mucilaginibacter terrae]
MRKSLLLLSLCIALFSCGKVNDVAPVADNTAPQLDAVITIPRNSTTETLEGEILTKQNSNPKFTTRTWQGIPSVTIGPSGNVYAAWYTGSKGEEPGNYITLSVSTDDGKSWANDELIINPTNPEIRFFDPAMWTDKYGNVYLSWSKSKRSLWDGIGGVWYSQIRYANGKVYASTPKRLSDGVMMCRPTDNYLKTGMLYPIAVWKTATSNNGVFIYKSNYDKITKSAQSFTKMCDIPFQRNFRGYDEHQIIQLKDRSYYVLLRGLDGLYATRSTNGEIWSTPEKFTTLVSASSRFFLGRLKSGRIALILNNSTNRSNLKIYVSDDEMKTWKYSLSLDTKLGISYPDMVEGKNGKLYVVYDYDRFGKMAINCLSFNENDVLKNAPENIERVVLSGSN